MRARQPDPPPSESARDLAVRGFAQGRTEALQQVAGWMEIDLGEVDITEATDEALQQAIEEEISNLGEKADRLSAAERQVTELRAQVARLETRPRQRDVTEDREAFQEGEREALMAVGAYLGCEGDMEEIAAAIEALKDAAPGPGPGEGEAELQAQLGAALAEQARLRKELDATQKELTKLRAALAPAPEPERKEGEVRLGDQVTHRGKRAIVVNLRPDRFADIWMRPRPGAKDHLVRDGYWETVGWEELAQDPQQDERAPAVKAALDALERHKDSPWLPALRAAYKRILAAQEPPPAVHKERCSAPGCARPAVWHGFLGGLGADGGLCSAHGGLSRAPAQAPERRHLLKGRTGKAAVCGAVGVEKGTTNPVETDCPGCLAWVAEQSGAAEQGRRMQAAEAWRPATCGRAKRVHAAPEGAHDRAKCGYRPSYNTKGWQEQPGAPITCPDCVGEQAGAAP